MRILSETMHGEVRAIAIEDGVERGPECGLEDCECPDHEFARRAGVYLTIRLDGDSPTIRGAHLSRVQLTWPAHEPAEPSDGNMSA